MTTLELDILIEKLQAKLTPDEQMIVINTLAHQHYLSPDGLVLLGNKPLADAQRDEDDRRGGLARLACRMDH